MLKIKNLSKNFDTKKVLNNISLDIHEGTVTVLLGQSGVGKSTILRILSGLEQSSQGEILLNDQELQHHNVGMLFQNFNLFDHLTILENITLPLTKVLQIKENEAEKKALELLQQYELSAKAHVYPSALSGGQKQRVALARTLAMQPKVLCLDEPTSALDPTLTNQIAQNINQLAKQNYIIVIATHDTELIKQLSCTIHLMQNGKIIESATTEELNNAPDQYPKIKNFTHGATCVKT